MLYFHTGEKYLSCIKRRNKPIKDNYFVCIDRDHIRSKALSFRYDRVLVERVYNNMMSVLFVQSGLCFYDMLRYILRFKIKIVHDMLYKTNSFIYENVFLNLLGHKIFVGNPIGNELFDTKQNRKWHKAVRILKKVAKGNIRNCMIWYYYGHIFQRLLVLCGIEIDVERAAKGLLDILCLYEGDIDFIDVDMCYRRHKSYRDDYSDYVVFMSAVGDKVMFYVKEYASFVEFSRIICRCSDYDSSVCLFMMFLQKHFPKLFSEIDADYIFENILSYNVSISFGMVATKDKVEQVLYSVCLYEEDIFLAEKVILYSV